MTFFPENMLEVVKGVMVGEVFNKERGNYVFYNLTQNSC
jgi:hypothetical protein